MNIKSIIKRAYIGIKQKKVKTTNGKTIKYIFEKARKSDELVICFSAFANPPAKYNYMGTLKNLKANKLFILDDLGNPDYPGVYYLGCNGDYSLKEEIIDLIKRFTHAIGSNCKLTTLGSSKGGVVRFILWH